MKYKLKKNSVTSMHKKNQIILKATDNLAVQMLKFMLWVNQIYSK
jgi:hypothetical protein